MNAGQMLAEARTRSKLSIRAAASRAGISATTWSYIESGSQSNARPTTLVRCALAVGLPPDAVLGALDLTIEERADVIQDVMTDLEHEREKAEAYSESSPEIGDVLSSIPDEMLLGEVARRLRYSGGGSGWAYTTPGRKTARARNELVRAKRAQEQILQLERKLVELAEAGHAEREQRAALAWEQYDADR